MRCASISRTHSIWGRKGGLLHCPEFWSSHVSVLRPKHWWSNSAVSCPCASWVFLHWFPRLTMWQAPAKKLPYFVKLQHVKHHGSHLVPSWTQSCSTQTCNSRVFGINVAPWVQHGLLVPKHCHTSPVHFDIVIHLFIFIDGHLDDLCYCFSTHGEMVMDNFLYSWKAAQPQTLIPLLCINYEWNFQII